VQLRLVIWLFEGIKRNLTIHTTTKLLYQIKKKNPDLVRGTFAFGRTHVGSKNEYMHKWFGIVISGKLKTIAISCKNQNLDC